MPYVDFTALRRQWPIARFLEWENIERGRGDTTKCPFCYESQSTPKPTFRYSDDLWICFRCHEGGDVIALAMRLWGLDFRGAVERLAGGDVFRSPVARARLRQAEPPRRRSEFSEEDEQRERKDFLLLDLAIGKALRAELALIDIRVEFGDLDAEEAWWEQQLAYVWADRLWEELRATECRLLYYLRRRIHPPAKKSRTVYKDVPAGMAVCSR